MRRIFIYSCLLALFSCLDEQRVEPAKPSSFVRYINGGNQDWAQAIAKTGDGGYIILANTINPSDDVPNKIKLVKTTAYGSVEWSEVFPAAENAGGFIGFKGYSIYVTASGYIISGEMIDTNSKSNLLIMNVDLTGKIESHFSADLSKSVASGNIHGMASYWSGANKLLVLGSVSDGSVNMVLAELNTSSSPPLVTWEWSYPGAPSTVIPTMFIDTSTDVVFGGTVTQVGNANETDMRLIKAVQNSQGTKFSIDYGESDASERVNGICKALSGSAYALIGSKTAAGGTDRDILFTKLSEVGGVLFSKVLPVYYPGSDPADPESEVKSNQDGNAISSTSDNGFVILGTIESTTLGDQTIGRGETDYYLIKVNGFGDVEWTQSFGSKRGDQGVGVLQADDGGYVILGTTQLANVPTIALIKTNSNGEIE